MPTETKIDNQSWALLFILSLLWGGSFVFIGIAVKELPSLLIVFARVGLAALFLLPVHWLMQGHLPRDRASWVAFAGMSLMNNVVPFTLITYGQHSVAAGLASVVNATTPMFAAVVLAMAGAEQFTARKAVALVMGLGGVAVLCGVTTGDLNQNFLAIAAILAASASYGVSTLWAKRRLQGIPPVTSATCQLMVSTVIMAGLAFAFSEPVLLVQISGQTWLALAGLALLSTSLAYLLFFRIIARAGASVVVLVTLIIPVTAILLGNWVLGESLLRNEIIGALIIAASLVVIDGRVFNYLKTKPA